MADNQNRPIKTKRRVRLKPYQNAPRQLGETIPEGTRCKWWLRGLRC